MRCTDHNNIKISGRCSVGDYTIIDIANDPLNENSRGEILIGNNTYIGDHCNIRASGSCIRIGEDCMIGAHVVLISANHSTYLGTPMRLQPWSKVSGITIGSDVWIGSHATILPGSNICDGAVVAAGAVVRGNVSSNTIVGGVPAKKLKDRTRDDRNDQTC